MVFLSKLYKIVSCIEEDKNQKYYLTYYKISELENYIEALQNDVTHMKETCVLLEDKIAMQKVLLQHAYHALPQEHDTVISGATGGATSGATGGATGGAINEMESEQVVNAMENNEVEVVGTLTSIKEEIINPDYIEEKNKMNLDTEYEHVINASSVDPAQKYKLWKGFFY
jgi:hypothetical protein